MEQKDCLFCALANKQIPTQILYEDDDFVVFPDLHPQAKVHWLIVPKQHYRDILDLGERGGEGLFQHLLQLIPILTEQAGIKADGFRLVNNCGVNGGQTIAHLHFHLLGAERLDP